MTFQIVSIGGLYLILVLVGQIFFKKAAGKLVTDSFSSFLYTLFVNWQLIIAFFAYLAAMLTWVWLLKQIDLSRLFPIMSAILLLTVPLASAHFLEETLSMRYWLGVACMLIGIGLIATEIKT